MFGWYVTKMRNYGLLAQRFRKAYDAIVGQQTQRVIEQIESAYPPGEERDAKLAWAERVLQTEYTARVPVDAPQVGS